MKSFLATKQRFREPEIMDDPVLDGSRHAVALRGLSRLNYLSRSAQILWSPLTVLARQLGRRQLRVLDVATGAGDVPVRLWHIAQRAGIDLEILGLDVSPRAVEFAAARAAAEKAAINFRVLDVLAGPLPDGFDVVTSSLFLHHLAEKQGVLLLQAMANATKHIVLVNDLRRSATGLALAHLAAWTLGGSDVVRVDGARSVRAAFRVCEAAALAQAAGLKGTIVEPCWPFRFLLTWQRS